MASGKPRISIFDFTCCGGCQLHVLELGERLLRMLGHVEVTSWREVMTGEGEYDIALCEGSITLPEQVERIQRIRQRAGILVSLGSCASFGCHNEQRNRFPPAELLEKTYGEGWRAHETLPSRPISAVVQVDFQMRGCPVSLPEFVTVYNHILAGQPLGSDAQPVCVECKRNDYLCVYDKGDVCLGPITQCGCNAICVSHGEVCYGCRGLMADANTHAAVEVLTGAGLHSILQKTVDKNRLTRGEILGRIGIYNSWPLPPAEELAHAR